MIVLVGSWRAGGWGIAVPISVALAAVVVALDIYRHRETVSLDADLARTLLHLLTTVSVASAILFGLGNLLLTGRLGF